MYEIPRFIVEVISAIAYIILIRYMIKPYRLTKEIRYLGLPLGFAFLALSEIILALQIIQPISGLNGLSVAIRTFAFVFIGTTYYFSKKPSNNSQLFWSITLSLLIVGLASLCLVMFAPTIINLEVPASFSIFLRGLSLFFISYICIHTLRSHLQKPTPSTFWIPLGFILLGISQYSQLIRMVDEGHAYGLAFVGGLATRFLGLAIFLYVAYRAFHRLPEKEKTN